jgi:hypothetical protein
MVFGLSFSSASAQLIFMANEAIDGLASSDTWGKTAMIVGHPGHELMVYHWMETFQPMYFCLTEGSGGSSVSRLHSSIHILESLGIAHGTVFGRYTDRQLYQLILGGRTDVFVELVCEFADALIDAEIDSVVGDAIEGFNPVHDICRFLINGAVNRVGNLTGRLVRNYDFVLDSCPDSCPEHLRGKAKWLNLDEAALERKLNAARTYPELKREVEGALARFGRQAFSRECLRPVVSHFMTTRIETLVPSYERFGEMRVNEGRYAEAIRYGQHICPIIDAIDEFNGQSLTKAC